MQTKKSIKEDIIAYLLMCKEDTFREAWQTIDNISGTVVMSKRVVFPIVQELVKEKVLVQLGLVPTKALYSYAKG